MPFIHKNVVFRIEKLVYINKKSDYQLWDEFEGYLKPILFDDATFNLSGIKEDSYKLTIQWSLDIAGSEMLVIQSWDYAWKYKIKDHRKYVWITFQTHKLLLTK